MIRIKLIGGLGNQLHIFAAGVAVAGERDEDLIVDPTSIPHGSNGNRKFVIEEFIKKNPWKIAIHVSNQKNHVNRKTFNSKIRMLERKAKRLFGLINLYGDSGEGFDGQINLIPKNAELSGHFLHFSWAERATNFGFPRCLSESLSQSSDLKDQVAIHIRLGDYLHYPEIFPRVPENYYLKTVSQILEQKMMPITLFTDDINGARRIYPNVFKIISELESSDSPENPWKVLTEMASCKYIIGANSTFSSWASWFNDYSNKEIFTPVPHIYGEWRDGLPSHWHRFDVLNNQYIS